MKKRVILIGMVFIGLLIVGTYAWHINIEYKELLSERENRIRHVKIDENESIDILIRAFRMFSGYGVYYETIEVDEQPDADIEYLQKTYIQKVLDPYTIYLIRWRFINGEEKLSIFTSDEFLYQAQHAKYKKRLLEDYSTVRNDINFSHLSANYIHIEILYIFMLYVSAYEREHLAFINFVDEYIKEYLADRYCFNNMIELIKEKRKEYLTYKQIFINAVILFIGIGLLLIPIRRIRSNVYLKGFYIITILFLCLFAVFTHMHYEYNKEVRRDYSQKAWDAFALQHTKKYFEMMSGVTFEFYEAQMVEEIDNPSSEIPENHIRLISFKDRNDYRFRVVESAFKETQEKYVTNDIKPHKHVFTDTFSHYTLMKMGQANELLRLYLKANKSVDLSRDDMRKGLGNYLYKVIKPKRTAFFKTKRQLRNCATNCHNIFYYYFLALCLFFGFQSYKNPPKLLRNKVEAIKRAHAIEKEEERKRGKIIQKRKEFTDRQQMEALEQAQRDAERYQKQLLKEEEGQKIRQEKEKRKEQIRLEKEKEEQRAKEKEKEKELFEKERRIQSVLSICESLGMSDHIMVQKIRKKVSICENKFSEFEAEVLTIHKRENERKDAMAQIPVLIERAEKIFSRLSLIEQNSFCKKMEKYRTEYRKQEKPIKLKKNLLWLIEKMSSVK